MNELDIKTSYGNIHVYKKGKGRKNLILLHGSGCDNAMLYGLKLYKILMTNIQSMFLICWGMERAINPITYVEKNFIIFIFNQLNKLRSSWD